MISPIYSTEHVQETPKTKALSNKIDYIEYKRKKRIRQAYIKRKQRKALMRFIIFCIICIIAFCIATKMCYKHIFLPIKNSSYNLEVDKNFFNSSEAMLASVDVLGHKFVTNNPYKSPEPLMKPLPTNRELHFLKAQLLPIVSSDPNYRAGFFIWDSKTNNFVSINGSKPFSTASIIKIPVLIELFRQIDQNRNSLDEKALYTMYHLASGSGGLQYKPVDHYYSLDHLARIMIQHSDNTATNILLDEIGGSYTLNKIMESWGIEKGRMENWLPDLTGTNVMTPKEFARMLYNINNPAFLSTKSSDKIIEYMSNIKHRNLLKSGLPQGANIAHKTGDIGSMVGDAGIITLPDGRQIIMVAMVERPWNSYKAKEIIREASRVTMNYFNND